MKGCQTAFRAIAKGNQIPFRANGMRNPRIACNADNVSNIPLRELNFLVLKKEASFKILFPIRGFCTRENQSNHTTLRPN